MRNDAPRQAFRKLLEKGMSEVSSTILSLSFPRKKDDYTCIDQLIRNVTSLPILLKIWEVYNVNYPR